MSDQPQPELAPQEQQYEAAAGEASATEQAAPEVPEEGPAHAANGDAEELAAAGDEEPPADAEAPIQPGVEAAAEAAEAEQPAESEAAAVEPKRPVEYRVAVRGLVAELTEDDVRKHFEQVGDVTGVSLVKGEEQEEGGQAPSTAVVTFADRETAEHAIAKLHQQPVPDHEPLLEVEWHEDPAEAEAAAAAAGDGAASRKRKAGDVESRPDDEEEEENKQLFFARVPRLTTEEQIAEVFKEKGHPVVEVVLFKATPTATESRGCGLLNFADHQGAVAALQDLNSVHTWPGMNETMVLKWGQPPDKRPKKDGLLMGPGAGGHFGSSPGYGARGGGAAAPPQGCDPDALRMFVGGIPKEATVEECEQFFSQYGKLVDFYLVRDRHSRESRGIAYVWYARKADAQAARDAVHDKKFLPGHEPPKGSESRPMSVREAQPRPSLAVVGGGGGGRPYAPPDYHRGPPPPIRHAHGGYHRGAPAYSHPPSYGGGYGGGHYYHPQSAGGGYYGGGGGYHGQPAAHHGGYYGQSQYAAPHSQYAAQPPHYAAQPQSQYAAAAQPQSQYAAAAQPQSQYAAAAQPQSQYAAQTQYPAQSQYAAQPAYGAQQAQQPAAQQSAYYGQQAAQSGYAQTGATGGSGQYPAAAGYGQQAAAYGSTAAPATYPPQQ